jgi:hypothetical protein
MRCIVVSDFTSGVRSHGSGSGSARHRHEAASDVSVTAFQPEEITRLIDRLLPINDIGQTRIPASKNIGD